MELSGETHTMAVQQRVALITGNKIIDGTHRNIYYWSCKKSLGGLKKDVGDLNKGPSTTLHQTVNN